MHYPPNSPYGQDPNQPAYGPNSGYNQPTMPTNQYQPYGQYPPPPPPQKPLVHQQFGRWYRRQWGKNKVLTGIITLVVVLLLCGAVSNGIAHSSQNSTITDSTTPTATQIAQNHIVPTSAPRATAKPTATPTPTPIPPTPTPEQVQPTSVPTQAPAPTCDMYEAGGVCYDTNSAGGSPVTVTPAGFCSAYPCVTDFSTANRGYIVECGNGKWSHSGGITGVCSRDGNVAATLYSH
jgi:hypothetical protein